MQFLKRATSILSLPSHLYLNARATKNRATSIVGAMAFWKSLDLSKVLSPNNNLLNVPAEVIREQETPPVIGPYKKRASHLEYTSIPTAEENMTETLLTDQGPHTPQHKDHDCSNIPMQRIKEDSAIKIQAFVRCHIQRKKFYIDTLQRRLSSIQKEKENALYKIERRKNKKFKKLRDMFHEEHIREEHDAEQRYHIVTGILSYLKREMKQAQLNLERNTRRCEDLKTQNQCLMSTIASTERSVVATKHQVFALESANARLQDKTNILKEVVALLGHHRQRITATTDSSSSNMVGLKASATGTRRCQGQPRVNSYTNTIAVNCGDDSEDSSCMYQLVQEVYVLSRHMQ